MRMYELGIPYLIRSLTPLHAGSGARVSGIVDLPIQREAHTGMPVIYGSSLKGALRSWAKVKLKRSGADDSEINDSEINRIVKEIFGPEPGEGNEGMGKAVFTDAKLLFFPVKSLRGIYAWITSPFLLNRFAEDVRMMMEFVSGGSGDGANCEGLSNMGPVDLQMSMERVLVPPSGSKVVIRVNGDSRRFVVLEDVGLVVEENSNLDEFLGFLEIFGEGLTSKIKERLVVVHDEMFRHLLSRGIEVVPHIRIDPTTNTVQRGGLWYQENLPPETFLYSFVFAQEGDGVKKEVKKNICKVVRGYLQFGGDATTGLGIAEILAPRDNESCWCKTAQGRDQFMAQGKQER